MMRGFKTSEAWVAIAGAATIALNKRLGLDLTTQDVMAIAGLLVSFIGSRWHQKVKAL